MVTDARSRWVQAETDVCRRASLDNGVILPRAGHGNDKNVVLGLRAGTAAVPWKTERECRQIGQGVSDRRARDRKEEDDQTGDLWLPTSAGPGARGATIQAGFSDLRAHTVLAMRSWVS